MVMNHDPIEKIVREVYNQAKLGCPTDAKSAIAKVVSGFFRDGVISYRTIERAFDRYIYNDKKAKTPKPETVKILCQYLGHEGYEGYIKKNYPDGIKPKLRAPFFSFIIPQFLLKKTSLISISLLGVFIVMLIIKLSKPKQEDTLPITESRCMVWAQNCYEEIACNLNKHPEYGTKVEVYNPVLINNFKKVDVNLATQFFSEETRLPLIWYYKKNKHELEYYTYPGVHPITGKTLDDITPEIIQKYVPFYGTVSSSSSNNPVFKTPKGEQLLNPTIKNTPNTKELGVFLFHKDSLDITLAKQLQHTLFKAYHATPYLVPKSKMSIQLREDLLSGNITVLGAGLDKHVDEVCIGSVTYSYSEKGMRPKRYVCNLQLDLDFFTAQGIHKTNNTIFKKQTGAGYTREEARLNAIKKLSL